MTRTTSRRALVTLTTLLFVGAIALSLTPLASAHGNPGTIKVHDDEVADPGPNNQPHVACDFWIEGFGMQDDSGELIFYGWPPSGNKSEVVPSGDDLSWTGTPEDKKGYHFLKGPYQLPPGHYRVEAFSTGGHPGGHDHFSKTKTFWVDPCGDVDNPCEGLRLLATANEGGSITINVTHAAGSDGSSLYRSVNGGPFALLSSIPAVQSQYLDSNTTIGSTYAYAATALFAQSETDFCDSVEITSVPVFPGAVAASLAALVGMLGYALARRRM